MPGTTQGYREIRQTGVFGKFIRFIFYAYNIVMLVWLIFYWAEIGKLSAPLRSEAERTGAAIGATIGTSMLLFFWVAGAGILGLLVMASRGPRLLVPITPTPPPNPTAADEAYPEVFNGRRYRREPGGSIVLSTPVGPKRFHNWGSFWLEING